MVQNTDEITIDYTQGNIQAQDGTFLESYTDKPVTNQVIDEKPLLETAIINSDGKTLDLGFSKAMQAPTGTEYEQFDVLVNGNVNEVTAAGLKTNDAEHILLTLLYPIGKNNQVDVSYTSGTIQSSGGVLLDSFQNQVVNIDNLQVLWVVKDIGWNYDTIQGAIDAAQEDATVKVWPGRYKESLKIDKPIHLLSSDPASETVQAATIIDGNEGLFVIEIESAAISSVRGSTPEGTVTIEGFTITNAMGPSSPSGERPPLEIAAGIIVNSVNTEIRNNIITKNGTDTSDKGARGIYVNSPVALVKIHHNTISHNTYTVSSFSSTERISETPGGGGIYIEAGSPEIYLNTLSNNTSNGNGGAIAIGRVLLDNSSRTSDPLPVVYGNTITANSAKKGGGIFVYNNALINNADLQSWNRFNVPNASEAFVEGNTSTSNNNTYTGNTLLLTSSTRNGVQDGANICFESQKTDKGTLSLRPEEGVEQTTVTLNIDYLIATQFNGGTLTINVPTGFEITDNASVIIGQNPAKPASDFTPTVQRIDITEIDLESGTVTLTLEEQEIPDGVQAEHLGTREVNYIFSAYGDADGPDSAWSPTEASTSMFISTPLSTNTDFTLTGDNPQLIQYESISPEATVLKVASETTVETILTNIESADGSDQTYIIYNNETSKESPLDNTDKLTKTATLVVTSAHGTPDENEYVVVINSTPFVNLYGVPDLTGGRSAQPETTWHDTIIDAVASANTTEMSTITVYPGTYKENISISKSIHLMSTDPTNETIQQTTILDGNQGTHVLEIGNSFGSSQRGTTQNVVVEGFTITNAMGEASPSGERPLSEAAAGIKVNRVTTAMIRNNIITKNGTDTIGGARGIYINSQDADVTLTGNVISGNYMENDDGGGIYIESGAPLITDNTIDSNTAEENGGGIALGSVTADNSSRLGSLPTITKNNITKNKAQKGAGIFIYSNMAVQNTDYEQWKRFNVPNASKEFVEHNSVGTNNNTYTDNELVSSTPSSPRNGEEEGTDICFEAEITPAGTLETSPATELVGDPFTFTATYTFDGDTVEASMTFELPTQMDLSNDASITIDGSKEPLSTVDFNDVTGKVFVTGITGTNQQVVLELNQHTEIPVGEHPIRAIADADGTGTAHTPSSDLGESDIASSTLVIEDKIYLLEKTGSSQKFETFSEAFNAINNSEAATISISESATVIVDSQFYLGNGKTLIIKPADGASVTFDANNNNTRIFYVDNAILAIYDSVLKNCKLTGSYGGSIRVTNSGGLLIERSRIINNGSLETTHGGGIAVDQDSTLEVAYSVISNNTSGGNGGAIWINYGSNTIIATSTISSNSAKWGGGINVQYSERLFINDSTFSSNTAVNVGGAINIENISNTVLINNATITSNSANTWYGGGIYTSNSSPRIENTVIASNTARYGGGIYNNSDTLYLFSGHICLNTAVEDGGGIYRKNGDFRAETAPWDPSPGEHNDDFSVGTNAVISDPPKGEDPVKVYDNNADGQGDQMYWNTP